MHEKSFTEYQLSKIQYILDSSKENNDSDYVIIWKVAWEIIVISHDIYKSHGGHAHKVRQRIRWELWKEAKRIFPELKNFKIVSKEFGKGMKFKHVTTGRIIKQRSLLQRFVAWIFNL